MRLFAKTLLVVFASLINHISFCQFVPFIRVLDINMGHTASSEITDIYSDSEDYLWIVSFDRIIRYDGENFQTLKTSTIKQASFLRFYEKSNGEKLVIDASNQFFQIKGDSLIPHPYNRVIRNFKALRFCADFYFDSEETLHISFQNGTYATIDSHLNIRYPLKEKNISILGTGCILRKGNKPFYIKKNTTDKSKKLPHYFYVFDSDLNMLDRYFYHRPKYFFPPKISTLRKGHYLASIGTENMFLFNESGQIQPMIYETPIIDHLVDKKGGIWLSTASGLHYYKDGVIDQKNYTKIVGEERGVALEEDYQGGIWFYSYERGLCQIQHPEIGMLGTETIKTKYKVTMEVVGTSIYTASRGGKINIYDLKTQTSKNIQAPIKKQDIITSLHYDAINDLLWVGLFDRLLYFDGEKWDDTHERLIKRGLYGARNLKAEHRNDTITLFGHNKKYFFYGKNTSITYCSSMFPFAIKDIYKSGDSTLIATTDALYLQINEQRINLTKAHPFLSGQKISVSWFDGSFWISVQNKGLYRLLTTGFERVSTSSDAPLNVELYVQNDTALWGFPIYGGALKRITKVSNSKGNGSYKIDSFAPPSSLTKGMGLVKDSVIYFTTEKNGIECLFFDDLVSNRVQQPVFSFGSVTVNGLEQSLNGGKLRLKHYENDLSVSFKSLQYKSGRVKYRYRIRGLKEGWSETDDRSLLLLSVPPGDYTLELQCKYYYQEWSNSKFIKFYIATPFWKEVWFFVLCCCIGISIIVFILRYQIRSANREKSLLIQQLSAEQKVLRAKMNPHFISNIFSSLQYLLSERKTALASSFVQKFSSILRFNLDQINKDFVSLKKELHFLEEYLQLEQIRLENKFEYKITVADSVNTEIEIPSFVIQPLLENAIQHGIKNKIGAGLISLDISKIDSFLKIEITDNGVGYNRTREVKKVHPQQRSSHGLKTIEERLKLLNGPQKESSLEIIDLETITSGQSGTRVTLLIKLTV